MTKQISADRIEHAILLLRGHRVLLDADLALLYGVGVGRLNESVKRNRHRFPDDFMFQLSEAEFQSLKEQVGNLKSQFAISSFAWGGRRHPPYAFTEQGVAMLSSVLRSKRAVEVNIEIMRTFVRLRQLISTNAELARKLEALEKKYDAQFKVVFDAIRQLMKPLEPKRQKTGFIVSERAAKYGRLETGVKK
jgi:hypothetical protein